MSANPETILGISFDGLAISGIVNEFFNVAEVLRRDKFRVLLDLGYDVTVGRTQDLGWRYLPSWISEARSIGNAQPKDYSQDLVEAAHKCVISGRRVAAAKVFDDVCQQVAALLFTTFVKENVRFLIIENGTLPDNPIFTEAVYLAISEYGARQGLGKYVFWRDHDLMWSAEPHLYGSYPYSGVRKPESNKHIHYVVTTEWMRKRMSAWAPSSNAHVIPYRFFSSKINSPTRRSLRSAYSIPNDAYLVARCTRVVPQKSIERDLHLLHEIQLRLLKSTNQRKIFLFISGPTLEDKNEFERLCAIEKTLSIAGQVVWGDGLLPVSTVVIDPTTPANRFSIRDLLAEADLSSFLTTYDYEGFGMPPGESMAMGVPFISTTYELYHEVYGSKGAVAPLLFIDRDTPPDAPIPDSFIDWTLKALTDAEYRRQSTRRNLEVCQHFFSLKALERQVTELFADALD